MPTSRRSGSSSRAGSHWRSCTPASSTFPTPKPQSRRWATATPCTCASVRTEEGPMLVDMHAHVIPRALDPVGKRNDHKGPRVGPCDDPHARLLENDRMQFKARDAFYSAQRRLEELERSEVD